MSVEVIVQGVVAVLRIEADFDVIAFPSVALQYVPNSVAEVSLHFPDQSADTLPAVIGLLGNQLFRERIHATTCLAAPNRTEYRNAGEESTLGDRQPPRISRGCWPTWIVDLSERGLFTGIAIFGAIGSGKTSGCMYPFAEQLIAYQADDRGKRIGGLVLEVKGDFCHKVREILQRYRRERDYVEVSLDSEDRDNTLHNDLGAHALAYTIA